MSGDRTALLFSQRSGRGTSRSCAAQTAGGTTSCTSSSVHYGTAAAIRAERAKTLDAAFAAFADRFRGPRPHPPKLPTAASINDPSENHSYGTNSE